MLRNYYFVSYNYIDTDGIDGTGMIHVSCEKEFEIYKCIDMIKSHKRHLEVVIINFKPVTEHYMLINGLTDKIIKL